jgi:hypothetical protein
MLHGKSWNRVMAMTTPWITPCNPAYGEPAAFKRTILLNCLNAVNRTCGGVTARGHGQRRNSILIKPDQAYQQITKEFPDQLHFPQ